MMYAARSALCTIIRGGHTALVATALGLAAYALWRIVQGVFDTDRHGWGITAVFVRVALLCSAATYLSLAWGGLELGMAWDHSRDRPIRNGVAAVLHWPAGRELVAVGGIVFVICGLAHFNKAWQAGFRRWFSASPAAMRWIDPVSRIGLFARGLLFVGVGGFVIFSALSLEPRDALGVAGLLDRVRRAEFGRWLLAAWAIGVMLFGVYSLIEAFVRRVEPMSGTTPLKQ